jgi:hypothetical protein
MKDYQIFYSCENVSLIITLLYDWLEDDVEYLIKPESILNLITDKFFFENLSECSENPSDKKKRILIMKHLEINLMKREYDILIFVSKFFENFYPDRDEKEFFLNSLERFCLHVLGYKFVQAYSSKRKNKKFDLIKREVNLLSHLIQIIIYHMKFDDTEDYFSNSESSNSPKIKSISKKARQIQANSISNFLKLSSLKSFMSPQKENLELNYQRGNSLPQFDINISEINNLDLLSQDRYLKKVYQVLGSYINENMSRKNSPIIKDNLSDISSIRGLDINSSFDSVIRLRKIENFVDEVIPNKDILSCQDNFQSKDMQSPFEVCLESNKIEKYSRIYKPRVIIKEDIEDFMGNETMKKSKVSHEKVVSSDLEEKSNGIKGEFHQNINYLPRSNNSIAEETHKDDYSESIKTENDNLHENVKTKNLQISNLSQNKWPRKKYEK